MGEDGLLIRPVQVTKTPRFRRFRVEGLKSMWDAF